MHRQADSHILIIVEGARLGQLVQRAVGRFAEDRGEIKTLGKGLRGLGRSRMAPVADSPNDKCAAIGHAGMPCRQCSHFGLAKDYHIHHDKARGRICANLLRPG